MSEFRPDFDSVFDREYWEPSETPQAAPKSARILTTRKILDGLNELCLQSAANIFNDEEREKLNDGTPLDLDPANPHTQPGTIMLASMEVLSQIGQKHRGHPPLDGIEPMHKQQLIHRARDIYAPAASLFKANSEIKKVGNYMQRYVVYPYEKTICNPELNQHYVRIVGLLCYVPDRKGNNHSIVKRIWSTNRSDPRPTGSTLLSANTSITEIQDIPDMRVGESLRYNSAVIRINSAEICLRGTLERAKAKNKQRRIVLFGKFATARGMA